MKNLNLNFSDCEPAIKDVSFRDVVIIGKCRRRSEKRSSAFVRFSLRASHKLVMLTFSNKWPQTM